MKTFTNSRGVRHLIEELDKQKVEIFIDEFNKKFEAGGNGPFHINTATMPVPKLNKTELSYARQLALKAGWDLTENEDNYQTYTYTMRKKV